MVMMIAVKSGEELPSLDAPTLGDWVEMRV
jgi:hypothetical protein